MAERSINITFHGVGEPRRPLDPGEASVWVSMETFCAVLDRVAERKDVGISFDDGNVSDIEQALPALRERGLRATFFIVAGRLGAPHFVDEGNVRSLLAAGMEIGCHGMRHRPWRGLDGTALQEELVEAKAILESVTGRPVTRAACPLGSYDRQSWPRWAGPAITTSTRATAGWPGREASYRLATASAPVMAQTCSPGSPSSRRRPIGRSAAAPS